MRNRIVLTTLLGGTLVLAGLWLSQYSRIYRDVQEVPEAPVAIVFGAAVYPGGRPSPVLADRVVAAVELYRAGKVRKLLFSGDNQTLDYNEPAAMLNLAHSLGIPKSATQPDYGGRRTYDTCYRARHIFQVKRAILVTQAFHLPRALLTCRALGIDAVGYAADRRVYPPNEIVWWYIREGLALTRALVDVTLRREPPVMGEPIPLF